MSFLFKLLRKIETLPPRYQYFITEVIHVSLSTVWPYKGPYQAICDGKPQGLEIRPSLIENAGKGLFATKSFKKGEYLCEYAGTQLRESEMYRTKNWDYVYGENGLNIDAGPHPNILARYVNHHFEQDKINCDFKIEDNKLYYVATRDIQAEEELYTNYGTQYWYQRN